MRAESGIGILIIIPSVRYRSVSTRDSWVFTSGGFITSVDLTDARLTGQGEVSSSLFSGDIYLMKFYVSGLRSVLSRRICGWMLVCKKRLLFLTRRCICQLQVNIWLLSKGVWPFGN